jgi:hypothetical protein
MAAGVAALLIVAGMAFVALLVLLLAATTA